MENILNFYQRSAALLAGQFQKAPLNVPMTNLQKLIYALTTEATNIQEQLQNLITDRWLATAEGVQLDGLGQILGLARVPGQPDDGQIIDGVPVTGYRQSLEFQIFINASSGVPEDVIAALEFFTAATTVWYWDIFPAAYGMATNGLVFPQNPQDLVPAIQALSPAGVNFPYLTATYNLLPLVFSTDDALSPLFVDPFGLPVQLEVSSGDFLYVDGGDRKPEQYGGFMSEYNYPDGNIGAGIICEAIVVNGNLPNL
jgi:hypothetical protein